jgi:aconitate hydratase
MSENLVRKIIQAHLSGGKMEPGTEVALKMDQALLQDATGTLAWLEFEQMGIDGVRTRQATQYIDHNMLQTGFENPDDHLFLQGMCAKYGAVLSKPGNGISHWAHLEAYDIPGETMLGCDSHTPHAGAGSMLAIGAGGLEVAAAMAGEPYSVTMPQVVNVRLAGEFKPWVSAKDVILELLRRFDVKWGKNKVLEFTGPALADLTVPERGTICNMCTELGATAGIFPADDQLKRWLKSQHREKDFKALAADKDAGYDEVVDIDLAQVEPLIARPGSPDDVVPVREVAGTEVFQVAVGSSVNSSFRDLTVVADILDEHKVHPNISMAVSPGSRNVLLLFMMSGGMTKLIKAGVRELEVACGPCIGMGFAPPTKAPSVRTFNRNFPGRSGTEEDLVYLCSPETAAATAIKGVLADPRDVAKEMGIKWRAIAEPDTYPNDRSGYVWPPTSKQERSKTEIRRGPNIKPYELPHPIEDTLEGEVLIRVGDNISTDGIMPAGARILPLRSNIPAIAEHVFEYVDASFPARARQKGGGFIVAGENYGQGSSREHAAAAPAHLGVKLVLAKGFARIHGDNLVNFGIPPLTFEDPKAYDSIAQGDRLRVRGIHGALRSGKPIVVENVTKGTRTTLVPKLTSRQREIILSGGAVRWLRARRPQAAAS